MSQEMTEQTALDALIAQIVRDGVCCQNCIDRTYGPLLAAYRAAILRAARTQQ